MRRYGPLGFGAALFNVLIIEFLTWVMLPWMFLVVFLVPFFVLDLALSAYLKSREGGLGEVGRGMLIGCISAPAAAAFFIPLYLLVGAVGLT